MNEPNKIQEILNQKGLTQGDFILLIKEKTGYLFGRSYISKICSGKLENYTIKTALIISQSLGVNVDDIIEEKIKKSIAKMVLEK